MSKVAKRPREEDESRAVSRWRCGGGGDLTSCSPPQAPPAPSTSRPYQAEGEEHVKDAGGFVPADYAALKNPFPTAAVAAVDAFNPVVKKTVLPTKP